MAKKKPTLVFNQSNLTFEQKKVDWRSRIIYGIMIFSGFIVFGSICVLLSHKFFPSPNEQKLQQQIKFYQKEYQELDSRLDYIQDDLLTLRKKDENLYRVIYQRDPIKDDIWKSKEVKKKKIDIFKKYEEYEIIGSILRKMKSTQEKMKLQETSYNELSALVQKKDEMLKSVPSIQPIDNKDLKRISSGFGYRIHPITRRRKMHEGIDFTASTGTPIHVTGDGVVEIANRQGGYGNCIVINHGYGYKTRYAHLSKYNVNKGQRVTRGQNIGAVGNTGASVGPHLHYEVEFRNQKVNPALFFFNDLSENQFEEIIKITEAGGKSFD